MKITILTLFPELFTKILTTSILGRAQKKGLVEFEIINIRDFGQGKHQVVDGRPFGGGAGMILRPDILTKAFKSVKTSTLNKLAVLMSASGLPFHQTRAKQFSQLDHLIIVCGRYEGVDQRFITKYIDLEISIGDYILTGGEIPAMVVIDATTRLLHGVLKKEEATKNESFSNFQSLSSNSQLLEYPQYTKPEEFEGEKVPAILRSGHHQEIRKWQLEKAIEKTKKFRPDLLERV